MLLREPDGALEARGPGLLWGTWQAGKGPVGRRADQFEPTGDVGRWADDGSLVWLGRVGAWFKDAASQKVGFTEVETALWETGLVADCALTRDGHEGARALVVTAPSASSASITAALVARLGRGRMPRVQFVPQIERTAHGKLVQKSIADEEHRPHG